MKKKRFHLSLSDRKNLIGWWYVLPFVIGFLCIYLPAIFQSAMYSFEDVVVTVDGMEETFIGWKNYSDAFLKDVNFRVIILDAFLGILRDVVIIVLFSFFIANVLNQKFFGRAFARTVFFLPVILATGLIAQVENNDLMMNLYGSNSGGEISVGLAETAGDFLNVETLLTGVLGAQYTQVIVDAVTNISQIINDSGVQILVFLAGLQSISPSVFEAARVEGATKWEEFWKITFPMMSPMILVNVIYTIIDAFTKPSYGVLEYIQHIGFGGLQFGYAAALSWIFCLMIAVILAIATFVCTRFMKYNT